MGASRKSLLMQVDQIQQREQKNPDDVHEVPVQTAVLDGHVVIAGKAALPRIDEHDEQHSFADDHVYGMHSGHQEVEREENFGVLSFGAWEVEIGSGDQMMLKLLSVFKAFDGEEYAAKQHREDQKKAEQLSLAHMRSPNRDRHREA